MNIKNRRWLLIISVLAIISFLVIFFFSISEMPERPVPGWYRPLVIGLRGPRPIPVHILLIPSVLLIVATIPISYYFMSQRLEKKLENNMIVISKLIKKNNSVSTEDSTEKDNKNIILKFLNPSERKVIEKLIETKGDVLQSEISRIEGMTKLKTHRAVKDLERKGIIKRESYGKTHRIILSEDIKDIMFKS
jgi:DNA-binding MarR family transcriptional regulator